MLADNTNLLVVAAAATIIAYLFYVKDLVKVTGKTHPNRWSWLIWSFATAVEAMTFYEVSNDWMKSCIFFLSAACCIIVTATIWLRSEWKFPSRSEAACLLASVVALVLWLFYSKTLEAHLLMVVAVPIAFIPTWKEALEDPANEKSLAWPIWTLGDLLTLWYITTTLNGVDELPFIVVEFVCHFLTWRLIARNVRKRRPRH